MPRVVVDHLPRNAGRFGAGWVVVAVDVFRATTTACTALASGRRCFPVASVSEAFERGRDLGAVLAGEQGGCLIEGFDLNNSPAELILRDDIDRPLVLLTSSGTELLHAAAGADAVFAACLRNANAQARRLRDRDADVAVIGAGTRDEVRMEDELCCARVAEGLIDGGFTPDARTVDAVRRWAGVPVEECAKGRSAAFLRQSGQERDIDFVVRHVDDVDAVYVMRDHELVGEEPW
jgi:2-phosphosulfolactate phosphatase